MLIEDAGAAARVEDWISRIVVGEQLCPFAGQPLRNQRVAFRISDAADDEALLHDLHAAASELLSAPREQIETTVLIVREHLRGFHRYNAFLDLADSLLVEFGWEGQLQLASFHPQYRFADCPADDPANWSNRAPLPLLHLLREDSVEQALAHHPDPEGIPERNVRHLREMDRERWLEVFGGSAD